MLKPFTTMSMQEASSLVEGEWLMNKHNKYIRFIKHDGPPGNLIWCGQVCIKPNAEQVLDMEDAVLYSYKVLSRVD